MKKAVFLCLILLVALGVPAFAADPSMTSRLPGTTDYGPTATGSSNDFGSTGTGNTGALATTATGTTGTSSTTGTTGTGTYGTTGTTHPYGTRTYDGTTNYRGYAADTNRGNDWGWLGLLGLIGLAGMFGRNRDDNRDRNEI